MPPDDSRSVDPRRDELRIGGWLEAFQRQRALPGRPPLVTPPPPRVPVFRPLRPRSAPPRPPAALASVEHPRQVRLRVALTCLAATVVGAAAFLVLADRAGTAPPLQQLAVADPVTLGPMPHPSSSAATKPPAAPASRPPTTAATSAPAAPHVPEVVHHSAPSTPPTAAVVVIGGLRVGATVGLAAAPGRTEAPARYRHQPASLGSFVVRRASTGGCVSFESADRPGYFLRHRDFVLHVDRADGSSLFRLDSAFCPVPSGAGSFRLRSANYPDRFVTAGRFGYVLAPVPASRATSFSAG